MFEENYYIDEEEQNAIRNALRAGKNIYSDYVCFEDCVYEISSFYEDIWDIMSENDAGDFEAIDGDLSY